MWISDWINWIISKRATPDFFQNYIKSKHLSWWIRWRKIWLQCRPFEPDCLRSEGWAADYSQHKGLSQLDFKIFRWACSRTENEANKRKCRVDHYYSQAVLLWFTPLTFLGRLWHIGRIKLDYFYHDSYSNKGGKFIFICHSAQWTNMNLLYLWLSAVWLGNLAMICPFWQLAQNN